MSATATIRAFTPEISWHSDFKPVLSLDVHKATGRIATAGADNTIWQLNEDTRFAGDGSDHPLRFSFLSCLTFHSEAVNAVRFSPDGCYLASAGDDRWVVIWQLQGNEQQSQETDTATATASTGIAAETSSMMVEAEPPGTDTNTVITPSNATTSTIDNTAVRTEAQSHPPTCSSSKEIINTEEDNSVSILEQKQALLPPTSPTSTTADGPSTTVWSFTPSKSSSPSPVPPATYGDESTAELVALNKETWTRVAVLRGHLAEVYDLAWSPSPSCPYLLSGSIDSQVLVWSIAEKKAVQCLEHHTGYVQGCGWDPLGSMIVTESSDRSARIYRMSRAKGKAGAAHMQWNAIQTVRTKKTPKPQKKMNNEEQQQQQPQQSDSLTTPSTPHTTHSSTDTTVTSTSSSSSCIESTSSTQTPSSAPQTVSPAESSSASSSSSSSSSAMFVDETLPSFFRRPAWSPDGTFLLLPAGTYTDNSTLPTCTCPATQSTDKTQCDCRSKMSKSDKELYCTWLFHRDSLHEPVACLPHPDPSVVCLFSPHLYQLPQAVTPSQQSASGSVSPLCSLPYAMLFVIATTKASYLYSTHHPYPIASVSNLHLSSLTDLAWLNSTPSSSSSQTPVARTQSTQNGQEQNDVLSRREDASSSGVLEEKVLISSSDGYVSVIELSGVAQRLSADQDKLYQAIIDNRKQAVLNSIEEEYKLEGQSKKQKKSAATSASSDAKTAANKDSKSKKVLLPVSCNQQQLPQMKKMDKITPGTKEGDSVEEAVIVSVNTPIIATVMTTTTTVPVGNIHSNKAEKQVKKRKRTKNETNASTATSSSSAAAATAPAAAITAGPAASSVSSTSAGGAAVPVDVPPAVSVIPKKKLKTLDSFFSKITPGSQATAAMDADDVQISGSHNKKQTSLLPSSPLPLHYSLFTGSKRSLADWGTIAPVLVTALTPMEIQPLSDTITYTQTPAEQRDTHPTTMVNESNAATASFVSVPLVTPPAMKDSSTLVPPVRSKSSRRVIAPVPIAEDSDKDKSSNPSVSATHDTAGSATADSAAEHQLLSTRLASDTLLVKRKAEQSILSQFFSDASQTDKKIKRKITPIPVKLPTNEDTSMHQHNANDKLLADSDAATVSVVSS